MGSGGDVSGSGFGGVIGGTAGGTTSGACGDETEGSFSWTE